MKGFIISKANLSTSVYQAFNLLWPFGSLELETQHHLEASRITFYQPNAGVGPNGVDLHGARLDASPDWAGNLGGFYCRRFRPSLVPPGTIVSGIGSGGPLLQQASFSDLCLQPIDTICVPMVEFPVAILAKLAAGSCVALRGSALLLIRCGEAILGLLFELLLPFGAITDYVVQRTTAVAFARTIGRGVPRWLLMLACLLLLLPGWVLLLLPGWLLLMLLLLGWLLLMLLLLGWLLLHDTCLYLKD